MGNGKNSLAVVLKYPAADVDDAVASYKPVRKLSGCVLCGRRRMMSASRLSVRVISPNGRTCPR